VKAERANFRINNVLEKVEVIDCTIVFV
jgi:hypothetical protein